MSELLIDTDGASDDLCAVYLAMRDGNERRLGAITTVAGAVDVEQATANVESVLGLAGMDIPVAVGADQPLVRPLENKAALRAHGLRGIAGVELPPGARQRTGLPAAKAMIEFVHANPGLVTIVCIGPLTNLALAIRLDPTIAQLLERVVISSGTVTAPGNVVPAADFNFWTDPEAAAVVLGSGAPMMLVPWDRYVESAVLSDSELRAIRREASPVGALLLDANAGIQAITPRITPTDSGLVIGDTLAVAISLRSGLVGASKSLHVAVETDGSHTRGASVVDVYAVTGQRPNMEVVQEIDRRAYLELLTEALTSAPI